MKTAVFCDFDGTIARADVGYQMFHHFSNGKNDELIPDWKAGRLSSKECLRLEAEMVTVTEAEFYQFIEKFEIDEGFQPFSQQCKKSNFEMSIVSDGLDIYIKYLLNRAKINSIPILSNLGRIEGSNMYIDFPFDNGDCEYCGNCKAERIRDYRSKFDEEIKIIFVGDGYSDACATKEADILFAKKDLEQFCIKNNVDYTPYDSFYDVSNELTKLKIL